MVGSSQNRKEVWRHPLPPLSLFPFLRRWMTSVITMRDPVQDIVQKGSISFIIIMIIITERILFWRGTVGSRVEKQTGYSQEQQKMAGSDTLRGEPRKTEYIYVIRAGGGTKK